MYLPGTRKPTSFKWMDDWWCPTIFSFVKFWFIIQLQQPLKKGFQVLVGCFNLLKAIAQVKMEHHLSGPQFVRVKKSQENVSNQHLGPRPSAKKTVLKSHSFKSPPVVSLCLLSHSFPPTSLLRSKLRFPARWAHPFKPQFFQWSELVPPYRWNNPRQIHS